MHEAQLTTKTSFITLTYDDAHLPNRATSSQSLTVARAAPQIKTYLDNDAHAETHAHEIKDQASLEPRDLQQFTKRLNEASRRRFGKGVRYYACGEYGDKTHRPHYHIAVYGEDFTDDRRKWKKTRGGHQLWRSSRLQKLWPHGDADIGELTFESAAYIARYVMKKMNGKKADEHYKRTDSDGTNYWIEPEFSRMSRRPGLGSEWFERYKTSVYPHDRVIVRGNPSKPPRRYDEYLKATDQAMYDLVKLERENKINPEAMTPERLRAGEAILTAALTQRKRPLE